MHSGGRVFSNMIKKACLLLFAVTATALAVVLPGTMRNTISLTWDYDTNSPPDVFKLYTSTNAAMPTTNWTLVAGVSGTIRNITISNINAQQCFFYVTASNWWGESTPSNVAGTPQIPGSVGNLRISQ